MQSENSNRSPLAMKLEIISDKLNDIETVERLRKEEALRLKEAEIKEQKNKEMQIANETFDKLKEDFDNEFSDILDSIKKSGIEWYFILVRLPHEKKQKWSFRLEVFFHTRYMYSEPYKIVFLDKNSYELDMSNQTKNINLNEREKLIKKKIFLKKLDELFNPSF